MYTSSLGGVMSRPAAAMGSPSYYSGTQIAAWANGSARPTTVTLAASMIGGERLFAFVDCKDATAANWPFASGSVIDDTRDWRKRYWKWSLSANGAGGATFPHEPGASTSLIPSATNSIAASGFVEGHAQSFVDDSATLSGAPASSSIIAYATHSTLATLNTGSTFAIYVDQSTGNLKLYASSSPSPTSKFFVEIWATSQLPNP
jgi:hypothetical protein